jgi:hypothetical protein
MPVCFEHATNLALFAGTIIMVPTTWSGWESWKKDYNGVQGKIFRIKIKLAFFILCLGAILTVWRFLFFGIYTMETFDLRHWIYLTGNLFLLFGAIVEGFYGGRLNHR